MTRIAHNFKKRYSDHVIYVKLKTSVTLIVAKNVISVLIFQAENFRKILAVHCVSDSKSREQSNLKLKQKAYSTERTPAGK